MAGSVNGRDQPTGDPKPNFSDPSASQFPQPSYPFPIDAELTVTSNYPVPQYRRQLEDAGSNAEITGNGTVTNTPLNHPGASPSAATTDPAITMPQPPNQHPPQFAPPASLPPLPTSLRASVGDSSERAQAPQTGDKRKRSKTSRACDECRRKKVRCDAPTEPDGTPKTCSNCKKAGVFCEFERKPMKRGPSRGYIRELSERVEQVELVQKQAMRQSLDAAAAFAPYAETILPDPASSATKRTLSFNEIRPFAPSDFQRDRIPSSGTWGVHSSTAPGVRNRTRGSLAIAPDQPIPPESTQVFEAVDPDWPEAEPSPPPKRRRLELTANSQPFKMQPTFLIRYYDQVEHLFPLLPDSETVLEVISQAPEFSHAFGVAIELLPSFHNGVAANGLLDNGSSNTSSEMSGRRLKRALASDLFHNYTELAAYLVEQMKEDPTDRTDDENLACLWTFLLLALGSENDIRTMEKEPMSKSQLLEYSLRTLRHLRSGRANNDRAGFTQMVKQAYNCACMLTKYHALSVGIGYLDLAPHGDMLVVGQVEVTDHVSPEAAFIAESSKIVGYSVSLLPATDGFGLDMGLEFIHTFIRPGLQEVIDRFPELGDDNPTVQKVGCFVDSLLVRVDRGLLELNILKAGAGMVDALATEAAASAENYRFDPLDMHVSALSVVTFCEIVNSCSSQGMADIANKYLNEARELLQKKSEAFHQGYGFEWFYAAYTPSTPEAADQYVMKHWTDCLLKMIDWVQAKQPAVEQNHDTSRIIFPNFQQTAKTGWLNIMSRF
ncbi:hypothetical protein A1O3_02293 [Capronia epimyces CBS 606.96]|uniref:Zn(2)-C6 fungal-type domain-containing protein n=1 Tax=Capronia epimyces CBS 606.96 TaxID=1182542 RepID=W9Y8P5_9EURO|nr:uncharacterized protein A1O3_02293 [Capronia epimyces CBS 606.96]EXJ89227.1 hypothetical protein A1O3_02293 [Capronia epimyces CBS 606.96]